jgi:hypothetical protein
MHRERWVEKAHASDDLDRILIDVTSNGGSNAELSSDMYQSLTPLTNKMKSNLSRVKWLCQQDPLSISVAQKLKPRPMKYNYNLKQASNKKWGPTAAGARLSIGRKKQKTQADATNVVTQRGLKISSTATQQSIAIPHKTRDNDIAQLASKTNATSLCGG